MRALSVFALILVCLSAVCGPAQERISTDIARHVVELGQVEGHERAVYSLAWSSDGTRLASGSGRVEARTGDSPIRVGGVTPEAHPGPASLGRGTHWPKAP